MATLAPQPNRIKTITHEFETTIAKFENGNEQWFCNREEEIVGFKLVWYFLTVAEQKQLVDFFKARKGAYEAFTLINHHEQISTNSNGTPVYQTYKVRFMEDKLTTEHFNNRFAGVQLEVILCL